MAHIETTIWDLAMAVGEVADAAGANAEDASDLAFCALANLLAEARLVDGASETSEALLEATDARFEAAG